MAPSFANLNKKEFSAEIFLIPLISYPKEYSPSVALAFVKSFLEVSRPLEKTIPLPLECVRLALPVFSKLVLKPKPEII